MFQGNRVKIFFYFFVVFERGGGGAFICSFPVNKKRAKFILKLKFGAIALGKQKVYIDNNFINVIIGFLETDYYYPERHRFAKRLYISYGFTFF